MMIALKKIYRYGRDIRIHDVKSRGKGKRNNFGHDTTEFLFMIVDVLHGIMTSAVFYRAYRDSSSCSRSDFQTDTIFKL